MSDGVPPFAGIVEVMGFGLDLAGVVAIVVGVFVAAIRAEQRLRETSRPTAPN